MSIWPTILLLCPCGALSLQLRYFDARGAAEVARVILALSGKEYVDHRYAIERKEGGGFETISWT